MKTGGAPAKSAEQRAIPLDDAMLSTIFTVAAIAVVLAVAALVGFGWRTAIGVAAGGIVATANLWIFALVIQGVLSRGRRRRLWGVAGGVKLLALIGGTYLLLRSNYASGITLAIGFGALPLGITIANFLRPREDDLDEPPAEGDEPDR